MFILKKGHQPGVYVPLRALFLVLIELHHEKNVCFAYIRKTKSHNLINLSSL